MQVQQILKPMPSIYELEMTKCSEYRCVFFLSALKEFCE